MRKILIALMFCMLVASPVVALEMPAIEGNFKYLPVAKVMTLGAGAMIADFSKDDSATPVSLEGWVLPKKFLYSSSLKGSVAWTISGENKETGLVPDYGGVGLSIDIMKLVKNLGATKVNTEVALTLDTDILFNVKSLFDSPAVLRLEPSIGASIKIKF